MMLLWTQKYRYLSRPVFSPFRWIDTCGSNTNMTVILGTEKFSLLIHHFTLPSAVYKVSLLHILILTGYFLVVVGGFCYHHPNRLKEVFHCRFDLCFSAVGFYNLVSKVCYYFFQESDISRHSSWEFPHENITMYFSVLDTFLVAETKFLSPKVKRGKMYAGSQFIEVSVCNRLAPSELTWLKGITERGGGTEYKQQQRRQRHQVTAAALFLSFIFHPNWLPSKWVTLTPGMGITPLTPASHT